MVPKSTIALVLFFGAVVPVTLAADCAQFDKLSLQLAWFNQPEFAGWQVPNSRDARAPKYEDECLKVQVRGGGPDFDPLEELSTGKADVALTEGIHAAQAFAAGTNLTIIANYFQRSAIVLVSLQKLGSIQDLAGKRIGVWCCGYDQPVRALFASANVTVTFVDQGFSNEQLYSGEIDMASAMVYNEYARILQQLDQTTQFLRQPDNVTVLDPSDLGVPFLHSVLVVRTDRLQQLRPRIVKLLRVVSKTWIFCRDNEAICVSAFPGDAAHYTWQMREINRLVFPSPSGLGVLSLTEWRALDNYLFTSGVTAKVIGDGIVDNSLVVEAGANDYAVAKSSYSAGRVKFCSPYGRQTYDLCKANEHTLCPTGHKPTGPADLDCSPCSRGRFAYNKLAPKMARMSACSQCPSGRHQNFSGSTSCTPCPVNFISSAGQPLCTECEKGFVTLAVESKVCIADIGFFKNITGDAVACGAGMTTRLPGATSQDACVCQPKYAPGVQSGGNLGTHCQACLLGMDCPGNGPPLQAQGYHVISCESGAATVCQELKSKWAVMRCSGSAHQCPHGPIGECASGRRGIGCSECKENMVPKDDGCVDCANGDTVPFALACIAACIMMIVLYYFIDTEDRSKQPHSMLLVGIVCGMVITCVQQLGVLSTMEIPWADPIKAMLDMLRFLNFDIETMRFTCVVQLTQLAKFLSMLAAILVLLIGAVIIHSFWTVYNHQAKFSERMPSLLGVLGTTFMMFLTPIVNAAILPLQCVEHPSPVKTVWRYPSVICWQGSEHESMVAFGIIFLLIPVGFVSGCCYVACVFPRRVASLDTKFIHTFAFLFFRFKSDAYWYAVCFVIRNMLIALTPTLPEPVSQITVMMALFLGSLAITAKFAPWRVEIANVVDIVVNAVMITVLCLGSFVVVDANPRAVAILCSIFVSATFALLVGVITYAVMLRFTNVSLRMFEYFICHHKDSAGAFARLLKMNLLEHLARRTVLKKSLQGVFIDCDDLTNVEMLFEYIGSQTMSVVILMTREVLSRPWCLGELVTAHKQQPNVLVAPITFPDFVKPDDVFIEKCTSIDITCLGAYGIDISMVQDMLRWLRDLPSLTISSRLTDDLVQQITSSLVSRRFMEQHISPCPPSPCMKHKSPKESTVAVLADSSNMESLASALVLCKLVSKSTLHNVTMLPKLLCGKALPQTTETCIFMFSNGVFSNADFVVAMFEAAELKVHYIPIITEESFRFPSKSMIQELQGTIPTLLVGVGLTIEADVVGNLVKDMFHEIAIVFSPQAYSSSKKVLMLTSRKVAERLLGTELRTLTLRYEPASATSNQAKSSSEWGLSYGDVDLEDVVSYKTSEHSL